MLKIILYKLWFKLKLNSNEFNEILNLDIKKYSSLNYDKRRKYRSNLIRKRNIAHELDNERNNK